MLRVVSTCNIGLICRKFSCTSFLRQAGAEAAPPAVQNINSTPLYIDHEPKVDDRGNSQFIYQADHSVYVAMSGGVDSSMAAALLKKKVCPFYS
jgi:hypothetical protein